MAYFLTKSGFDVELIIVSNIDLLREKAIEAAYFKGQVLSIRRVGRKLQTLTKSNSLSL